MDNSELKDALIGKTLLNTYLVGEQLGAGGMGTLYKARHTVLGQDVALKFVQHQLRADVKTLKRLRREAQILSGLHHPNIVAVKAFHIENNADAFLVMEYLQGQTLEQYVKEHGPLDLAKFMTIYKQVCDALIYAHANGVVHRDLKPANIMLISNDDGSLNAKLLDFGLAKFAEGSQNQKLTATGTLVGSINYISPEQCAGGKIDQRADIYSLACVMFDTLTGQVPFDYPSGLLIIRKHLEESLPPLPESLPRALSNVLQCCTAVVPGDRLGSVQEMWTAIETGAPVAMARKSNPRAIKSWILPVLLVGAAALVSCASLLYFQATHEQQTKRENNANVRREIDGTIDEVKHGRPAEASLAMDGLERIPGVTDEDLKQMGDILLQRLKSAPTFKDKTEFADGLVVVRKILIHRFLSEDHPDDAVDVLKQTLSDLKDPSMPRHGQDLLAKDLLSVHFMERDYYYKTKLLLLDVEFNGTTYQEVLAYDRQDAAWATARRMVDYFNEGKHSGIPGAVRGSKIPPSAMTALVNRAATEMIDRSMRLKKYDKAAQVAKEWLEYMDKPNWASPTDVAAMVAARDNAEKLARH